MNPTDTLLTRILDQLQQSHDEARIDRSDIFLELRRISQTLNQRMTGIARVVKPVPVQPSRQAPQPVPRPKPDLTRTHDLQPEILHALLDIRQFFLDDRRGQALRGLQAREDQKERKPLLGGMFNTVGDTAETLGGAFGALLAGWVLFSLKWKQLTGQLSGWLQNWAEIIQSFTPTVTAIIMSARGIWNMLLSGIRGFGKLFTAIDHIGVGTFRSIGKALMFFPKFFGVFEIATSLLSTIGRLLALPLKFIGKVLWPIQAILSAFDFFSGASAAYEKAMKAGADAPAALLSGFIGGLGAVVKGLFSGMDEILGWLWNAIVPDSSIKTLVEDFGKKLWTTITGAVAWVAKSLVNALWIPDEVKADFNKSIDEFLGTGKKQAPPKQAQAPAARPVANKPATSATSAQALQAKSLAADKAKGTVIVSAPSSQQVNNVNTSIATKTVRAPPPSPIDPQARRMLSY